LGEAHGASPSDPEPTMSANEELTIQPAVPGAPGPDAPAAIRVEDLHKSFRIPTQRVDSLKERAVHPFSSRDYRELHALDGVSFEIRQGEFFGIVGRNGSGKSTLLKLLASIYRADSGRIQIAGRLAPFIELGVGFNQELTARENVVLNGVMMGLTPKEVRERQDAVIDFAELHDFADLKLKNFSSGMLVRLAFSVMLQADADVLLIDEVLAVGDAAFQQKCADAFHQMKGEGKTIVLVTHDMASVEAYCHRAMLLADGEVKYIGAPALTGNEYLKLNFEGESSGTGADDDGSDGAKLLECKLVDDDGEEIFTVEERQPIRFRLALELQRKTDALHLRFVLANSTEFGLFEFGTLLTEAAGDDLTPDKRLTVEVSVENRFAAGRHFLNCGIHSPNGINLYRPKAATFVVFGAKDTRGVMAADYEIKVASKDGR
jgi:ABC-type polysaccharide/polyol phosphate transport system ATPase subunit